MVAYMVFSPLFARAGNYVRRWWIVGVGVILWSLASGCSGWATSFFILFLTRCFVGIGEAAYGPIAPAMLSDLYPVAKRGRMMAIFYLAIPVGSALGFVIGGFLADAYGWRHAFEVTFVGIIFGVFCLFMKEPQQVNPLSVSSDRSFVACSRELLKVKSFVLACAGMTCTTFVLGGVATWVPVYIFQREAKFELNPLVLKSLKEDPKHKTSDGRPAVPDEVTDKLSAAAAGSAGPIGYFEFKSNLLKQLSKSEIEQYGERIFDAATDPHSMTTGRIGLVFGAITVVMGLLATLAGGWVGDRMRAMGIRGAYFHAAGWTTVAGWPFFLLLLLMPFPGAWIALAITIFLLFFNTGPTNTVLANVARSPIRATAFAINIFVIHAFGDAISPLLIGFIADISSLQTAFAIVSVIVLLGGGLWITGARYLDEDTKRAEANLHS